jgi:hypothetical protein
MRESRLLSNDLGELDPSAWSNAVFPFNILAFAFNFARKYEEIAFDSKGKISLKIIPKNPTKIL